MKKLLRIVHLSLLLLFLTFNIGVENIFADSDPGPHATTIAATPTGALSATLNGLVFSNGEDTTVMFEYGPTADYQFLVSAIPSLVLGTTLNPVPVQLPLTGLADNTLYHFRVRATYADETTAYGEDMTFFIGTGSAPTATTAPASPTSSGATLNGSVMPGGVDTIVTFDYGLTSSYGSTIPANQNPVSGLANTAVSAELSELLSGITYHFRVRATNIHGTSIGNNRTFTVPIPPPSVTTEAASSISSSSAILHGSVNAFSDDTIVTFQYGTNTSYGTTVTADQSPVTGASPTPVSTTLTGLTNNQIYHYRVVGENSGGRSPGEDMTFTTSVAGPAATTNTASDVQLTSATLRGLVNANNRPATITFQYGTTTNYSRSIEANPSIVKGNKDTPVTLRLSGLVPDKTYYFRVIAAHGSGAISLGSSYSFTTKRNFPWTLFLQGATTEK